MTPEQQLDALADACVTRFKSRGVIMKCWLWFHHTWEDTGDTHHGGMGDRADWQAPLQRCVKCGALKVDLSRATG